MIRISNIGAENQSADDVKFESTIKHEVNGLKLSHVHGYRGYDCRDNLFYINDGNSIIYHAAGTGIVLDLTTCN